MKSLTVMYIALAASLFGETGAVRGSLLDETGVPVTYSLITARPIQPVQPGYFPVPAPAPIPPFAATSSTDGAGQFEIDNLPPGKYQFCINKPGSQLLDPCIWGNPATATVGTGVTQTVTATVIHGVTITIRIADRTGLVAGNPQLDDLIVGTVSGLSPFVPALVQSKDATGKTLSIVVPKGKAGKLSVYSSALTLGDAAGKGFGARSISLPLTVSQTLTSVSGGAATFTIQILGAATKP